MIKECAMHDIVTRINYDRAVLDSHACIVQPRLSGSRLSGTSIIRSRSGPAKILCGIRHLGQRYPDNRGSSVHVLHLVLACGQIK